MTREGAQGFAMLALLGSLGATLYQDLSHGGLGSHGGARRYIAIGVGGGIALVLAGIVPPLGALAALLLLGATVYTALSRSSSKGK